MKKQIKFLKQQVKVAEKDALVSNHFSSLVESNKNSHQRVNDEIKHSIENRKQQNKFIN